MTYDVLPRSLSRPMRGAPSSFTHQSLSAPSASVQLIVCADLSNRASGRPLRITSKIDRHSLRTRVGLSRGRASILQMLTESSVLSLRCRLGLLLAVSPGTRILGTLNPIIIPLRPSFAWTTHRCRLYEIVAFSHRVVVRLFSRRSRGSRASLFGGGEKGGMF